jgi:hypothetical protein
MTDKQYVIRAAQIKGLDLLKPTKSVPEIYAVDYNNKDRSGCYKNVIDAKTWTEARQQIDKYYAI